MWSIQWLIGGWFTERRWSQIPTQEKGFSFSNSNQGGKFGETVSKWHGISSAFIPSKFVKFRIVLHYFNRNILHSRVHSVLCFSLNKAIDVNYLMAAVKGSKFRIKSLPGTLNYTLIGEKTLANSRKSFNKHDHFFWSYPQKRNYIRTADAARSPQILIKSIIFPNQTHP